VVIGQTVSWLSKYGAINYLGSIHVVRGGEGTWALVAALLVRRALRRRMSSSLGTARALGEVEALEALGVDRCIPGGARVMGMAAGHIWLTVFSSLAR